MKEVQTKINDVLKEIKKVIVGQDEVIKHILVAIFCDANALLESYPGLGKTTMIKTLSDIMDLKFSRIQSTPDLMPTDITGTYVLEEADGKRVFTFHKGPIFANIILADEINRTPPKTQAALLEAMQEHRVTAAGTTYQLPDPFFVLATQNPIEQEGTYPLPEAQLDRFMFNLWLDYPSFDEEIKIVKTTTSQYDAQIDKVLDAKEIIEFQDLVRRVPVAENVIEFAVKTVNMTRPTNGNSPQFVKDWITWGAGPRASQYLTLAAKTRAIMEGRFTPNIDDVKVALLPVLRHRIITNFSAEAEGISSVEVIKKISEEV